MVTIELCKVCLSQLEKLVIEIAKQNTLKRKYHCIHNFEVCLLQLEILVIEIEKKKSILKCKFFIICLWIMIQ